MTPNFGEHNSKPAEKRELKSDLNEKKEYNLGIHTATKRITTITKRRGRRKAVKTRQNRLKTINIRPEEIRNIMTFTMKHTIFPTYPPNKYISKPYSMTSGIQI